jgi:hypothetical protein
MKPRKPKSFNQIFKTYETFKKQRGANPIKETQISPKFLDGALLQQK